MNILISDNWLRDYLKTSASPEKIAKFLSLSGPSVEKVAKAGKDSVYSIEITTNRIDAVGVYGIAREASAILPTAGIKAKLLPLRFNSRQPFVKSVGYLKANVDTALCPRFTAVLIKNVKIAPSPEWIKQRLSAVGVRPINNVVDISNYIMGELGQPVHTFDYDKIKGSTMKLRASKQGEKITTLDGKIHTLPGGDIVIEDGEGRLIDLAGIMGGQNSAIEEKSKNVLLFVQTYSPAAIRRTSMSLSQRTQAAEIFEKGIDPELVSAGIRRGIDLFEELTGGKAEGKILDIYPNPERSKTVSIGLEFVNQRLGVELTKTQISSSLQPLGFETSWKGGTLAAIVPSWRARDVDIPEDIVEEVARIYGYHRLPGKLMEGLLPEPVQGSPFIFETRLKNILKGYGAVEVYTLSLVSEKETGDGLKLKNPLGEDTSYLRTALMPSLLLAAKSNAGTKEPFHLFEMSNVYLRRKGDLPLEKMTLAGIYSDYSFRKAKGQIEALLEELNIDFAFGDEDSKGFIPNQRIAIKQKGAEIGQFGTLEEGFIYYEFSTQNLFRSASPRKYKDIPSHPPQIEDVTFVFPQRTKIGEVIDKIRAFNLVISEVVLKEIYSDAYTFRIWYQHPDKTLTDAEIEKIREEIIKRIKEAFGGTVK